MDDRRLAGIDDPFKVVTTEDREGSIIEKYWMGVNRRWRNVDLKKGITGPRKRTEYEN